jgi:hypothetical protein
MEAASKRDVKTRGRVMIDLKMPGVGNAPPEHPAAIPANK